MADNDIVPPADSRRPELDPAITGSFKRTLNTALLMRAAQPTPPSALRTAARTVAGAVLVLVAARIPAVADALTVLSG